MAISNTHKVEVSSLFIHQTVTAVAGGLWFHSSFNVLIKKNGDLAHGRKEEQKLNILAF